MSNQCNIAAGHAISSSSLFHFTDNFDIFKSIVTNGLRFSYARERFSSEIVNKIFGENAEGKECLKIPMISFCDTPITRSNNHAEKYGKYVIGIKKEHLKSYDGYNLNPVFYMAPDKFNTTLNFLSQLLQEGKKDDVCAMLAYIKPISVIMKDECGNDIEKDFYDEREWRMVFPGKCTINEEQADYTYLQICNIDFSMISHIIVEKESEINDMIKYIIESKTLFGCGDATSTEITIDHKHYLISKITSFERIEQDY